MSTQVVTISEPVAAVTASDSDVTITTTEPVSLVTVSDEQIAVAVTEPEVSVTVNAGTIDVAVTEPVVIVAETVAGPQGPPGVAEDQVPYAERVDFVGDSLIYRGYAELVDGEPGPAESDAVWRIKRLTFTGPDVSTTWADGNADFDNAWTTRESLTYS